MYFGWLFFTDISRPKPGTSLIPCATPFPTSFTSSWARTFQRMGPTDCPKRRYETTTMLRTMPEEGRCHLNRARGLKSRRIYQSVAALCDPNRSHCKSYCTSDWTCSVCVCVCIINIYIQKTIKSTYCIIRMDTEIFPINFSNFRGNRIQRHWQV